MTFNLRYSGLSLLSTALDKDLKSHAGNNGIEK